MILGFDIYINETNQWNTFSFTYFKYKNEIYSKEDNFIEMEGKRN